MINRHIGMSLLTLDKYIRVKLLFNYLSGLSFFVFHVFYKNAEFDPRIVGLTGPTPAIRQMAQEYRVFFKKVEEDGDDYLVESSHNM